MGALAGRKTCCLARDVKGWLAKLGGRQLQTNERGSQLAASHFPKQRFPQQSLCQPFPRYLLSRHPPHLTVPAVPFKFNSSSIRHLAVTVVLIHLVCMFFSHRPQLKYYWWSFSFKNRINRSCGETVLVSASGLPIAVSRAVMILVSCGR